MVPDYSVTDCGATTTYSTAHCTTSCTIEVGTYFYDSTIPLCVPARRQFMERTEFVSTPQSVLKKKLSPYRLDAHIRAQGRDWEIRKRRRK